MRFKHFIITRFNATLMSEPIELERVGVDRRYDPAWLEERVKLFEKVCAPTLKKQTCKDFEWLVIFGDNTHPEFINSLRKKHKFTPILGSQWRLYENLDTTIRRLSNGTAYVMTTNVDSDDGLSIDFIEKVQEQFQPKDMGIYVTCGVRWNLSDNTYISTESTVNPFHTIVEPVTTGALRTSMSLSHGQLHGYYDRIIQIRNKTTRWLAGIHDNNLVNRMNPTSEDKLKSFDEVSFMFGI